MKNKTSKEDIKKIIESRHNAPHKILGPHYIEKAKAVVVRAFLPYAERVYVALKGKGVDGIKQRMKRTHNEGFFELILKEDISTFLYQLIITDIAGNTLVLHDPYAFLTPHFNDIDSSLFDQGKHTQLFNKLGAHPIVENKVLGVNFTVWAPNALRVSVVGTFNSWDGRCHQMRLLGESGVWEIFIPDIWEGELYKYEIKTKDGDVFLKTDPFAFYTEVYPKTAAIVYDFKGKYEWSDGEWMEKQNKTNDWELPISIYKVDMDSWMEVKDEEERFLTFREFAKKLIHYLKDKHFTHIEISPSWYPLDYMTSYYAPNAQYGKPEDFMTLVDICHQNGIGVIVDWIPAIFSKDLHELLWFDGTQLYEHEDNGHKDSFLFNYGKKEVRNFLIANALFWVEKYHIDGLCADSMASALYLDYLKNENERFSRIKMLVKDYVAKQTISEEDINRITQARHNAPHSILGMHYLEKEKGFSIAAFLPYAEQAYVLREGLTEIIYKMNKIHEDGLFETIITGKDSHFKYQLHVIDKKGDAFTLHDPYAFDSSAFSDLDRHLYVQGNHYHIFEKFGAHPMVKENVHGVNFAIWAPNAQRVSVVGTFNDWDGRCHQMRLLGESGICEIFIPGLCEGEIYKYEIRAKNGDIFLKTDPYAFYTEVSPKTTSVVYELEGKHRWRDDKWMQRRAKTNIWELPISIYEVHMGSWMRKPGNKFLSYRERAEKLVPYVKSMGFTHIEILPIAEHPYDPSWGYQITNFYAPTSRFGTPDAQREKKRTRWLSCCTKRVFSSVPRSTPPTSTNALSRWPSEAFTRLGN